MEHLHRGFLMVDLYFFGVLPVLDCSSLIGQTIFPYPLQ